jgi:hypothetical protein
MIADYNRTDVSLEHNCDWTSYCTLTGHYPVCTCRCTFKLLLILNVLLLTSQLHGRSPVCTCWCDFKLLFILNVLLHISQRHVRSKACISWRCSTAPSSLDVSFNVPCYKEKKEVILPFSKEVENIKSELYINYTSIISQDMCSLSNSSKRYKCTWLWRWTICESNTSFPVTRQYFRMMCDKDILQLFFEDLS